MKIYVKLESPHEWVRVDGQRIDAFGEVPSLGDCPITDNQQVIGVVPGEWITAHQINLPAKTRKQFVAALPYALEESVSEDIEDLHFVSPTWKAGEDNMVMVVAKNKMCEWQQLANKYKLPVENIIPDYALVPKHAAAEYTLAVTAQDAILANHAGGVGVSIDADLIDVWIMGLDPHATIAVNDKSLAENILSDYPQRDVRHWSFGDKMAHWLEHTPSMDYDLMGDEYQPTIKSLTIKSLMTPFIIALSALLLKVSFDAYRYVSLHSENNRIDVQMKAVVTDTFPGIGEVPHEQERLIMEQAIKRHSGAGQTQKGFNTILAKASKVLNRNKVTLSDLSYRNEGVMITCLLNDFSQVDKLTNQFNSSQLSATLESSTSEENSIVARFSLREK